MNVNCVWGWKHLSHHTEDFWRENHSSICRSHGKAKMKQAYFIKGSNVLSSIQINNASSTKFNKISIIRYTRSYSGIFLQTYILKGFFVCVYVVLELVWNFFVCFVCFGFFSFCGFFSSLLLLGYFCLFGVWLVAWLIGWFLIVILKCWKLVIALR